MDLSISYNELGYTAHAEGKLTEAKEYYTKSLNIRKELVNKTGTYGAMRDLSMVYNRIGDIFFKDEGDISKAKEYYSHSHTIFKTIADKTGTVEAYDDLAFSYYELSTVDSEKSMEHLQNAIQLFEKLCTSCPEISVYAQMLDYLKVLLE